MWNSITKPNAYHQRHCNGDSHRDGNSNSYSNSDVNGNRHSYGNGYCNSDGYCYCYCGAEGNSFTETSWDTTPPTLVSLETVCRGKLTASPTGGF